MEGVLDNNLMVIPSIREMIDDLISYFWQPSMGGNYSNHRSNTPSYRAPKREVDKKNKLSLDNVMVLTVEQDSYITILGIGKNNHDERVLLRNGAKEALVIEQCLRDNLELGRESILSYMDDEQVEIYNNALQMGNYQYCLDMLKEIENCLNITYQNEEEVTLRKTR